MTGARYEYFRRHIDLQAQAASGWLAALEGRHDEALQLLSDAADREDVLGKHPVSPGPVLPVRELYGEVLLELGRSTDALAAYEAAMELSPGRLAGVYGAGRAAELAGDEEKNTYYQQVLSLAHGGNEDRPEVAHARKYLDRR